MSPPEGESRPAGNGSQQVSWSETRRFLEAVLAQANVGPLPWAGSPEWCAMSDRDPRKLLALAADGEHHVLRKEIAQTALAEASRAVSGAVSWKSVASEIQRRRGTYIPRRAAS